MAQQCNKNSKYVNPHEVTPDKPFHIAFLREITDQYDAGEISYGKMVEMLNDVAIKWHNSTISKMETVQTAVEWYYEQTVIEGKTNYYELLEQAKAMEKEQIMSAWLNGDADSMYDPKQLEEQAEQYYNETYGKSDNL